MDENTTTTAPPTGLVLIGSLLSLGAWGYGIYLGQKLLHGTKCERPRASGKAGR